jgi:hypothetical protein
VLPTQDLGVEIAIILSGDGASVCLATDLDTLVVGEVDVLYEGVCVEWVEVEGGEAASMVLVVGCDRSRSC